MNIREFKNKHKGERCFILGNGPSLGDVNFKMLEGEITFGTNGIFKNDWGFTPTYYACVNPLLLHQWGRQIMELDMTRFMAESPNAPELAGQSVILDTRYPHPAFETDLELSIWEGHTVTYVCLQLAYYMGFEEVILLGVDHYYGVDGQPNSEVEQQGPDMNHWSEDYFEDGLKWHLPDLKMSELAYSLAKNAFESDGRRVINASVVTALDVFERQTLRHVLNPVKVSAIVSAYKAERFMQGCLDDLQEQTLLPEIVVVAQRDSDEARITMENMADNITLVLTDDIPTIYEAWNLGVTVARGQYLTNANTDDRHAQNAYELMASVLDANPDISLVYHDCGVTWNENEDYQTFAKRIQSTREVVAGRHPGKDGIFLWPEFDRQHLTEGCYIGPQPMWRANLHQRYGLFDPAMQSAGDYEFWLRISRKENLYHLPLTLGLYCAREDGVELGDIPLSTEEGTRAVYRYQDEKGVSIRPVTVGHAKVSLGDEYGFVHIDNIRKLVEGLNG